MTVIACWALMGLATALLWGSEHRAAVLRSTWTTVAFAGLLVLGVRGIPGFQSFVATRLVLLGSYTAVVQALALRRPALALLVLVGSPLEILAGGAGLLSLRLMVHRAWPSLRFAFHWVSFTGTWAVLIPVLLSEPVRTAWWLALLPAGLSLGLMWAGAREFLRVNGTPEPNDPPPRLVTTGVFSLIQHPIQLAEILSVVAAALVFNSTLVWVYAGGFALILKLPLRWYEEHVLAQRFGDAYRGYSKATPRYLPLVWPRLKSGIISGAWRSHTS